MECRGQFTFSACSNLQSHAPLRKVNCPRHELLRCHAPVFAGLAIGRLSCLPCKKCGGGGARLPDGPTALFSVTMPERRAPPALLPRPARPVPEGRRLTVRRGPRPWSMTPNLANPEQGQSRRRCSPWSTRWPPRPPQRTTRALCGRPRRAWTDDFCGNRTSD